ncbi:MAG: RT0821/Lpp0805 family surface protein [Rhodoblastus sp.]
MGGCSLSVPMVNSAAVAGVDREPTGSIKKVSATEQASPLSHNLDIEDWRRARAALGTALDPQGNGATVAWDNPQSGRKGTFIPVAAPYPVDGQVCRAFIAKLDSGEAKEVVQGSACRTGGTDDWTVKDVKPFRQS